MEFLSKRERLVLIATAEKGKAGIEYNALYSSLSLLLSKDSILKAIEELYLRGYITIIKVDEEIRIVASKNVRKSMVLLEFYKSLIAKTLQELKRKVEEIKDEAQRKKIIEDSIHKLSSIVLYGIISLTNESPEFTIPEFIESLIAIKEPLQILSSTIVQWRDKEVLEVLIRLIAKYIGEENSQAVIKLMENMLSSQEL